MSDSRVLLRRCLLPILVLAGAVLVAAGCGDASSVGREGIIPKQASLVVTVDIRDGKEGQLAQLREVLRRIPAFPIVEGEVPDAQRTLDQFLLVPGGKVNLTWEEDVQPWLGDTAGLAGWYDEQARDEVPISGFAWFDTSDEVASQAAARKSFGAGPKQEHDGTTIYRGKGRAGTVHWATLNERLLLARDARSIEIAIEAEEDGALEDDDDFERLARQREGNEPLLLVQGTDQLFTQARAALTEYGAELPKEQLAQFEQALDQYEGMSEGFSFSLGATDVGLWMDGLSVRKEQDGDGDEPAGDSALELVESLPDSSVVAFGTTAGANVTEQVEGQRDSLESTIEQLEAGLTPLNPKLAKAVTAAFANLTSKEMLERFDAAYGDHSSAAVLLEEGRLAFVSSAAVEDATAARALVEDSTLLVDGILSSFSKARAIALSTGEDTTVTISGIPAAKWRAQLLATLDEKQRKLAAANPLLTEFLQPSLSGVAHTTDEVQQGAFPTWGLEPLQAAADGTDTLGDLEDFRTDIDAVDVPKGAQAVAWIDLDRLLRGIIEPIDPSVSFIVDAQASSIGGPVSWSTVDVEDGRTITGFALEIPLHD